MSEVSFVSIFWSDDMACGFAEVDKQHRFLVETLIKANKTLLDDGDFTQLTSIARDLLGYALVHFSTEEELMQKSGYLDRYPDEAAVHLEQHRAFSRRVVGIIEAMRERRQVSHLDVLAFLNEWLRGHILGTDRQTFRRIQEDSETVQQELSKRKN